MDRRPVLWVFIAAMFMGGNNLQAAGAKTRSLSRSEDPVILTGEKLPSLCGLSLDKISLMTFKDNQWKPVPFQVDEKDDKGQFVFTNGEKVGKDQAPYFDANDELVFMVFDTGDKAPEGVSPPGAEKGVELEIIDPVDNSRAWAYLFLFTGQVPRSEKDYVKMTINQNKNVTRVEAKNYISENTSDAIYYNYLSIIHPDGSQTPDLIDRLKIRGTITLFFGSIKFPFNFDELVKSRLTEWIDGPIRLVRQGEGYLEIGEVKIKGTGSSISYYYPNFFIYPMTIDMPIDLKTMLTDIQFHGATDFNENAYGMYYYDKYNPWNKDVVFDGKMSDAEKNMNYTKDHDWCVNTGPQGTLFHRIFFPKEWGFTTKTLYYVDDTTIKDPPEANPGLTAVGYQFNHFINVKKGPATYYMHYYFPPDFKVGDEDKILNILDHPLEVKFRNLAGN